MVILLFLLACFGLTTIIVHGEIMDILKIRPFLNKWNFTKKLIKCSLCVGVYVSALLSILYFPIQLLIIMIFAGAGFSFLLERTVIFIDEKIIKLEKERKQD